MLKNGKLARVIFGVSVPSAVPEDPKSCQKQSDNRKELVESYSVRESEERKSFTIFLLT